MELSNYVAITRSPLIPASRPPEPTTMDKPGLRHGYVTRSGRAVKPNIKPNMRTFVTNSVRKREAIESKLGGVLSSD